MPKIIDGDVLNYLQNKLKDNYATKDGDLHLQEKELNYSNEVQTIVPDTGYNGISKVKLPGLKLEEATVKSTKVQQEIYPETDVNRDSYIKKVTIQPRTLQEKSVDIAAITEGTPFTPTVIEPDENFNGLSKVTATSVVNMQSKTANYSNQPQEITADEGYSGLSSVMLQPYLKLYNSMVAPISPSDYYHQEGANITDDDLPADMTELELNSNNNIGIASITSNRLTKFTINAFTNLGIYQRMGGYRVVSFDIPNAKMIIGARIGAFIIYNVSQIEFLPDYAKLSTGIGGTYAPTQAVYCPLLITKVVNQNNEINESAFYLVDFHNNQLVITDNNVVKVNKRAFSCDNLSSITLPNSILEFGEEVFYGTTGLTTFTFPTSLQKIGNKCFAYSSIENITIPDTITEMGTYVFSYCKSLQEAVFPDNFETVPERTFENCTNLQTISLGPNINIIAAYAFYNCTSLVTITVRGNSSCTTAQTLQSIDSTNYNNATIVYTE